jgi:hypothetical protein
MINLITRARCAIETKRQGRVILDPSAVLIKCECVGENSYWVDCPKLGHGNGCYGSICLYCGEYEYLDCDPDDRRY